MSIFKRRKRLAIIITVFLSVVIIGSCAPAIKYSYDMTTNFSEQKSYSWAPLSAMYGQDPLLVTNVQVLVDQVLTKKGFTRMSENSDLMISMSYESEYIGGDQYYQLRMLTLNIYKITHEMPSPSDMPKMSMHQGKAIENKDLVWRGTAFGTINTDAASGDLREAVKGILSNFPPK